MPKINTVASGDAAPAGNAKHGQVYLYDLSGNLLKTFDDPTPTSGDQFGSSLAIDGDRFIVGAPFDDTQGVLVGDAHVYSVPEPSGIMLLAIACFIGNSRRRRFVAKV